jgi:hypothetical protein
VAAVAAEQGGEVALLGQVVCDDRKLGWATQWRMDWRGRTHFGKFATLHLTKPTDAVCAAQVLSGNGDPGGRLQR